MNQLIANDTYDKGFVEKHCVFRSLESESPTPQGQAISEDDYRKQIAKYTPERVDELSGVPADQIQMLGRLFGDRS